MSDASSIAGASSIHLFANESLDAPVLARGPRPLDDDDDDEEDEETERRRRQVRRVRPSRAITSAQTRRTAPHLGAQVQQMVPKRLVKLAAELKQLDEADDAESITTLSKMGLPQMTSTIRDIDQRAANMERDQAREDFRVKSLLQNLLHQNMPGQGNAIYAAALSSPTLATCEPSRGNGARTEVVGDARKAAAGGGVKPGPWQRKRDREVKTEAGGAGSSGSPGGASEPLMEFGAAALPPPPSAAAAAPPPPPSSSSCPLSVRIVPHDVIEQSRKRPTPHGPQGHTFETLLGFGGGGSGAGPPE